MPCYRPDEFEKMPYYRPGNIESMQYFNAEQNGNVTHYGDKTIMEMPFTLAN